MEHSQIMIRRNGRVARSKLEPRDNGGLNQNDSHHGSYLPFFIVVGTVMAVIFFLVSLPAYQIVDHTWFSAPTFFMTIIVGAAMMLVVLFFMLGMYKNSKVNTALFIGAGLMLLLALWLVHSQASVTGVDYRVGVTPHNSIVIVTGERANGIIEAQR